MLPLLTALLAASLASDDPAARYAAGRAAEATDLPAARAHYGAACQLTHPAACRRLALLLLLTGEDLQAAIDAYASACDQGDLQACVSLATIGTLGTELLRGQWLSEACRTGDAQACVWWAGTLTGGDADRAYQDACRLGAGAGCWQQLQRHKDTLPAGEATRLRAAACAGGVSEACALP